MEQPGSDSRIFGSKHSESIDAAGSPCVGHLPRPTRKSNIVVEVEHVGVSQIGCACALSVCFQSGGTVGRGDVKRPIQEQRLSCHRWESDYDIGVERAIAQ